MKISKEGIRLFSDNIQQINYIDVFDLMGRRIYFSDKSYDINSFIPVRFTTGGLYVVRIKANDHDYVLKGLLIN